MGKSNLESIQKELLKALLEGDDEKSIAIAKDTISQGASPLDFFPILNNFYIFYLEIIINN
mgnify:CR=1 FL=1